MRGADDQPGSMFSYVTLEERVPKDHPLREIRRITDRALIVVGRACIPNGPDSCGLGRSGNG